MISKKQRGVLVGVLTGLLVTMLALGLSILLSPAALMPRQGFPATLIHVLRWDVLVVVCLLANIGALARHRFFSPEDIDGGGLGEGTARARVLQATLQNTLEQTVLAVVVHLIWAATMPFFWQAAVPVAAVLFFVGRLLFWRGYSRGAPARALGFALTFYPSGVMLLMVVWGLLQ